MNNHTPGPWHLKIDGSGIMHIKTAGGTSLMSNSNYGYPPAYEADWHLIAAAPELLEALETLLALNENYSAFGGEIYRDRIDRACGNARAVLKKARGEK